MTRISWTKNLIRSKFDYRHVKRIKKINHILEMWRTFFFMIILKIFWQIGEKNNYKTNHQVVYTLRFTRNPWFFRIYNVSAFFVLKVFFSSFEKCYGTNLKCFCNNILYQNQEFSVFFRKRYFDKCKKNLKKFKLIGKH